MTQSWYNSPIMRDRTLRWITACPTHPAARLICPVCLGARGGRAVSERKAAASRRNAVLARTRKAALRVSRRDETAREND